MSSSSLNKMTVPLGGQVSQGLLMPKLKYRFRVFFENFGTKSSPTTELTKQVISVSRPNLTFEEIAVPIYNSTVKLAGRHSWADITCSIRDDATGAVGVLIGEQLQKQLDFMEMASASSGIDYKFKTVIQVLDGGNGAVEPTVLETWELYGCYLKGANYGDLNYGTNEAATIEMTIGYDNANQSEGSDNANTPNAVGAVIGRTLGSVATGTGTSA